MDEGIDLLVQKKTDFNDAMMQAEWAQKKLVWIPNEELGYIQASIVEENGDKVKVRTDNGKELTINADDIQRMNPPKFDKVEDMAELTCLNEASVLYNLSQRYYSNQIYTYSSLFCVVINPYKKLPIYTDKVIEFYKGRKRYEVPPHIYAISDIAYRSMLYDRENQSILCTGESGAGKTENTKRVIQYLVSVASKASGIISNGIRSTEHLHSLEEQLLKANPILEAFGNAKTIKNDNSSRFGKFIKICFEGSGFITGTFIETFILEKGRIPRQQPDERNFHIFYQLLNGCSLQEKSEYLLESASNYKYLTNGDVKVSSLNDSAEFKETINAMEIMDFTKEDMTSLFKTLSAVLLFGNMVFTQDRNSDQAILPNNEVAQKICKLLSIGITDFTKGLLKPTVKVGREFTVKSQNKEQVEFSSEALSKAIYERLFKFVVQKINKVLDKDKNVGGSFIGILDIAGFEIFKMNSFEQLCINYTNEKLQQLFNHTMFVLEQEEYQREGIEWKFIDFGLDLQPCIDLLEKPMGIFSLLDEECWFPKATDKSLVEKYLKEHSSNNKFAKPDFRSDSDITIIHYAGNVNYSCQNWLSKNMDPLNETVINVIAQSNDPFVQNLFKNRDGIVGIQETSGPFSRSKKGMFRTIGQLYKDQLNSLMGTLKATVPNFVRCIIPNYEKKPGKINAPLVIDQLKCNGVLEGIRICRQGYPNRVSFQDFRQRYEILTPHCLPQNFMDARKACQLMLEKLDLDVNLFKIGQSKVFFKAGVLASLEEERDKSLAQSVIQFQALARGKLTRQWYIRRTQIKFMVEVVQRNIRRYFHLREWMWWRLFTKVKPLLQITRQDEEMRMKEEEINKMKERLTIVENDLKDATTRVDQLSDERSGLINTINSGNDLIQEMEEKINSLTTKKSEYEDAIADMESQLQEEESKSLKLKDTIKNLMQKISDLEEQIQKLEAENQKLNLDKVQNEGKIRQLEEELTIANDTLSKLQKEKKTLDDRFTEISTKCQSEEEKAKSLAKLKAKNETNMVDLQGQIEELQNAKNETEKAKNKLEQKCSQLQIQLQESSGNLDNLDVNIKRKDTEISELIKKLDDETAKLSSLDRNHRQTTALLEEIQEELENERQNRLKAEKTAKELDNDLRNLRDELEETQDTTVVQKEIQQKREKELEALKAAHEQEITDHEHSISELKSKHNQVIQELNDRIDTLTKSLSQMERTKSQLSGDCTSLNENIQVLTMAKADLEKKSKNIDQQLQTANKNLSQVQEENEKLTISFTKTKAELDQATMNLEETESKLYHLESQQSNLNLQISDLQDELQSETNMKIQLQTQHASLQRELHAIQEQLEEEELVKENAKKQLLDIQTAGDKARMELMQLQTDYEVLENSKKQIHRENESNLQRIQEIQAVNAKLEKSKRKFQDEFQDLNLMLDKERQLIQQYEKKQKKFDQLLSEEKEISSRYSQEKEAAERVARQNEAKVLQLSKEFEEIQMNMEDLEKSKRNLQNELDSMLENKDDQGRNMHELEKVKKSLELQLSELRIEKEEIEDELQITEDARTRLEVNMAALRSNFERDLAAKDEAADEIKRNLTKQLREYESMLEDERKSRGGMSSSKKKLEVELINAQSQVQELTLQKEELHKSLKKATIQIKDMQREFDELRIMKDEAVVLMKENDRRLKSNEQELLRTQEDFHLCERQKKQIELEKDDLMTEIEVLKRNSSSNDEKKRLESQIIELKEELDDINAEKDSIQDRYKRCMAQVEQLNGDLQSEKSTNISNEGAMQSLEKQVFCKFIYIII